ncbi:MAG: BatD family protein [Candidatus Omnitrophica bacterium]|nr:BatD family protein [Candidatus Omnitrophota bacterium]
MKRAAGLLTVLFLLLPALDTFAETGIKAEVDKASMTTDDHLTYKIIITSSEQNTLYPQLPAFKDFNVFSQAQSSSLTFDKQGIKNTSVFIYVLLPKNTGKLKIEPSQVKIKDKSYSTEAFEIEVAQGKAKAPPQKEGTTGQEQLPQYIL